MYQSSEGHNGAFRELIILVILSTLPRNQPQGTHVEIAASERREQNTVKPSVSFPSHSYRQLMGHVFSTFRRGNAHETTLACTECMCSTCAGDAMHRNRGAMRRNRAAFRPAH